MEPEITITLVEMQSGRSESLQVSSSIMTVEQLAELASALLDVPVTGFVKDSRPIIIVTNPTAATLQDAGIVHGDLLIAQTTRTTPTITGPPLPTVGGGLDFSTLLGSAGGAAAPVANNGATAAAALLPPPVVYYDTMNLYEAQVSNPHPLAFCRLLRSKEHLMKEMNYYDPSLAIQLRQAPSDEAAAEVWKIKLIKGGIARAMKQTTEYLEEQSMQGKLKAGDETAKEYFRKKEQRERIVQQRMAVMDQYPESFGQVLMLYIDTKINGHHIQAFCDSGAQTTVMSHSVAKQVGIEDWIDEAMSGTAVGVGTTKILGRVHSVNLTIHDHVFPCTITVLEDHPSKPLKFLLGLDMMKRHLCILDLQAGCLKFKLGNGYLEAPFLHEKDLDQESGGTKGFDAAKANEKFFESMKEDSE